MKFTKDDMVCEECSHKLTYHWSGSERSGCGCTRDENELIIKCTCTQYSPQGADFNVYTEYSVEDAKLTILRKLGY